MYRADNKCIRINCYGLVNGGISVLQSPKCDAMINGCFFSDCNPLSNDDALGVGKIKTLANSGSPSDIDTVKA